MVVYIGSDHRVMVTPISATNNALGRPINAGLGPNRLAITPDGKTAYVVNLGTSTVTRIATTTNTPGRPIKVGVPLPHRHPP